MTTVGTPSVPMPHRTPPRAQATLATRGSKLAMWQADYVTGLLAKAGLTSQKNVIKTTADRVQDRFLHELAAGGKGLFIKELEEALVAGTADLAVHSLKDMPAVVHAPFTLAAILPRHAATDVLIIRPDVWQRLGGKSIPAVLSAADVRAFGSLTVGTGSLRRQSILRRAAPDLQCVGIRGNVDTRLAKLAAGSWDALILAEASLDRLSIQDVHRHRLAPDWFIPCASQGALAIESRLDDELTSWLAGFGCPETTLAVAIERGLLAMLGGDCTMPFGCLARVERSLDSGGGRLVARAGLYANDRLATCEHAAPLTAVASFDVPTFVTQMMSKLAAAGGATVLQALGIAMPEAWQE